MTDSQKPNEAERAKKEFRKSERRVNSEPKQSKQGLEQLVNKTAINAESSAKISPSTSEIFGINESRTQNARFCRTDGSCMPLNPNPNCSQPFKQSNDCFRPFYESYGNQSSPIFHRIDSGIPS